jgi:hypothetical protein
VQRAPWRGGWVRSTGARDRLRPALAMRPRGVKRPPVDGPRVPQWMGLPPVSDVRARLNARSHSRQATGTRTNARASAHLGFDFDDMVLEVGIVLAPAPHPRAPVRASGE